MKLHNVVSRVVIDPRKLTQYALNSNNPQAVDKALMFQRYLGFTPANYQQLLQQIEMNALDAEAIAGQSDEYGQRYRVDLSIVGVSPNQQERVRTGWIVKPGEDFARLVTLYITRRT
ncbi:MAG: DUF6883 domain-containing protein [Spirulinaceae cyanobacterium]